MTRDPLPRNAARRTFLLLTVTRWFPVGLVAGTITLLALERGLDVAQIGAYVAFQGVAVALLELPTSGLADTFGRRPVLLVAAVINIAIGPVYLLAHSFWAFAAAATLMGVFRALDSGPLEAWYVDAVRTREPEADVAGDLARAGTLLGLSLAVGAVVSGALIAWHPVAGQSRLVLPLQLFTALNAVNLLAVAALLREPPRATGATVATRLRDALDRVPTVVGGGLRLAATNPVLRGLLLVEVFWSMAMTVFELLFSVRLAEVVGDPAAAGAFLGPAVAAGWAVFSVGSAAAGRAARRWGSARTAIAARVLNGGAAASMGTMAGPAGLIGTYLATYTVHGLANPVHGALLHDQATAANRTTILSMNSLTMFLAGVATQPLLGALAGRAGTPTAMITGGLASMLGALWYLPALRQQRDRAAG